MSLQRGEVYFVDLDPVFGHEQAGRRPVVVMSNDVLNRQRLTVLVVPGTTRKRQSWLALGNVIVPCRRRRTDIRNGIYDVSNSGIGPQSFPGSAARHARSCCAGEH